MNDKWLNNYNFAKQYFENNGHLLIPQKYEIDNIQLGVWVANQRKAYKNNKLSKEKINLLNEIKMVWDMNDFRWLQYYLKAIEFYKIHGNLFVPRDYKVEGLNLGEWIVNQRKAYKNNKLSKDEIEALDDIDMIWNFSSKKNKEWDIMYEKAKEYCEREKHGLYIYNINDEEQRTLATWINEQRISYKNNTLTKEKFDKLNDLEMIWEDSDEFEKWAKPFFTFFTKEITRTAIKGVKSLKNETLEPMNLYYWISLNTNDLIYCIKELNKKEKGLYDNDKARLKMIEHFEHILIKYDLVENFNNLKNREH